MLFTQPLFFAFFAVVLAGAWALRDHRLHKLWLLAASYLFYAAWDWRFLSLIVVSTLVDWGLGLALARTPDGRRAKALVGVSLVVNLGILGVFKYYGFFLESAAGLLATAGFDPNGSGLRAATLVLPVGISFYTFQTLSYTIDVYRRRLEPVRNLPDFALFVGFFPQLVAGPIVRASHFLPQLARRPVGATVDVRGSLVLFLVGFVKKAAVADNVAPVVDRVFGQPEVFGAGAIQIAVLLYAVQIYCDFSGYSDMAIACARLLGYDLGPNFRFPYLAASVADFWHRWHISLSTWLRDYLYIPLGGSRGTALRTARNLMVTMVLGGLWHGAAWTFVVWGALHGTALIAHRQWRASRLRGLLVAPFDRSRRPGATGTAVRTAGRLLASALTLGWVALAWIFFRAESFADAWTLTRGALLLDTPGTLTVETSWWGFLALLAIVHWMASRLTESSAVATATTAAPIHHPHPRHHRRPIDRLPDWAFGAAYGAAAAVVLLLVPLASAPFIYFQF